MIKNEAKCDIIFNFNYICQKLLMSEKIRKYIKRLAILSLTILIGIFILETFNENNSRIQEEARYNISYNPLFSEKLDYLNEFKTHKSESDYIILANYLCSCLYYDIPEIASKKEFCISHLPKPPKRIRTKDYEFHFQENLNKLIVYPVLNNIIDSTREKVYLSKLENDITNELRFNLINKKSKKKATLRLQFDYETNPKRVLIVRFSDYEKWLYCKRGVLYQPEEQNGEEY